MTTTPADADASATGPPKFSPITAAKQLASSSSAAASPRKRILFPWRESKRHSSSDAVTPSTADNNPPLARLDRVLQDKTKRAQLLSVYTGSFESRHVANKIRCALAVQEFRSIKEKVERKQRGRKIVATFCQNGAIYHVQDVPAQLTAQLLAAGDKFVVAFDPLHLHCRLALVDNADVMREVDVLLA